jgi:signal transduction histidine kinase/CheY-like chemotaxis protein
MKIHYKFKKHSLFQQILISCLIPALILFIALFSYSLIARLNDAVESQQEIGHRIAENIASISELALLSGNNSQLMEIIKSALAKDISEISIYNAEETKIITISNESNLSRDHKEISVPILQRSIILENSITGEDYPQTKDIIIGRVSIQQSQYELLKLQKQIITVSVLIGFLSILIGIASAWFLSRRISHPLAEISRVTNNISAGELDGRIKNLSKGELGDLQQHINHMADSISFQQHELKIHLSKLEIAKAHAEEANKAKSLFLATMTHELRTPMNGALGMLQILSTTPLSKEQNKYVYIAKESSEHLLNIVNNILDYSQIEKGQLRLHESYFQAKQLLDGLLSPLKYEAEKNGVSFNTHICSDLDNIEILGDITRIRQILLNMAANAVKFTHQGSISISLNMLPINDNHLTLSLTVEDTGIGIKPEDHKIIFGSFQQADSSSRRQYTGSGLGLAIVSRLCELMGADIHLKSDVDQGSSFTVKWSCQYKVKVQNQSDRALNAAQLAGKKVLVVEDNPVNLMLVTNILSRWEMHTVNARDGMECIDAFAIQDFDLVLMDLQMPVMDGFEATKWIRAQDKYIKLPIIALTANNFQDDREQCFALGMNDFISKPISLAILKQKVTFWLS